MPFRQSFDTQLFCVEEKDMFHDDLSEYTKFLQRSYNNHASLAAKYYGEAELHNIQLP
jgi:hypothetical protein